MVMWQALPATFFLLWYFLRSQNIRLYETLDISEAPARMTGVDSVQYAYIAENKSYYRDVFKHISTCLKLLSVCQEAMMFFLDLCITLPTKRFSHCPAVNFVNNKHVYMGFLAKGQERTLDILRYFKDDFGCSNCAGLKVTYIPQVLRQTIF